jgi:hypothetical protein
MDTPPPAAPSTTRVGGGASARAAAAVFVVVLVGLALVGLSGRAAPLDESAASLPPVPTRAAQAEPSPRPAPSPTTRPTPEPPLAADPYSLIMAGEDAYAVFAHFGGRDYLVFLHEYEPGQLTGRARMPFPRDAAVGEAEFLHLWTRRPPASMSVLGTWPIHLDPLIPETTRSGRVLEVSQPADPAATDAPRLMRQGYELVIRAEGRSRFALLVVNVTVAPSDADSDAGIELER